MVNTYKRIKNRNNARGRNATCWEYLDDFKEIYETKHSVTSPLQNLLSSLKATLETDFECVTIEECRKRTAISDNILNFLKKNADEENPRHEEMMTLEQQERVEALNNIRSFLGQLFGTDLHSFKNIFNFYF